MGAFSAVCLIALALVATLPTGDLTTASAELLDWPALVFVLCSVLFARSRTRGSDRVVWGFLALAISFWLVAEAIWDVRVLALDAGKDASVADLFWLLYYPPLLTAFYLKGRSHTRASALDTIDALIVTIAMAAIAWEVVLGGSIETSGQPLLTSVVDVAYPAFDIGLLWLLIRPAWWRSTNFGTSDRLLVAGFAGIFVADMIWLKTQTDFYGLLAALAFMPVAAAAIIDGSALRHEASTPPKRTRTAGPLVMLAGIVLTVPVLLHEASGPFDPAIAIALGLVLVLFVVRLILTIAQNERLLERSEGRAIRDPLTGLGNHGYFHERLDQELVRATRTGESVALLMIDIDKFKLVNDLAGHRAGDRILAEVAGEVRETARGTDIVCRIGGDELAVIAPATDGPSALLLAERLRHAVHLVEIPELGVGEHATISIGCCSFPGLARTKNDLTERADSALYAVKSGGRDDTALFDPSTSGSADATEELERMRAELIARESDFRAVFAHALDPMVIFDDEATILNVNAATEEFVGMSRERMVGQTLSAFADPTQHARLKAMVEETVQTGRCTGEIELTMPDGGRHLVEFSTARFSPGQYLTSVRDITARMRAEAALITSEQRFKGLFEAALDAIYITNNDGIITDVNAAGCKMTGKSRSELVGSSVESLAEPGRAAEVTDERRRLDLNPEISGSYIGIGPDDELHRYEYTVVADFVPGEHVSIVRELDAGTLRARNDDLADLQT